MFVVVGILLFKMDKELKKLYYDPDSAACYGGVTALYREAKKHFPKIKLETIETFLAKQNTYTLHKPVRRRFPRNKIVTAGLDVDWQADLADLQSLKKYNNNYCYILVVVDVLSRYLWAEPLKRKTPPEVMEAFKKIIKSSGRTPWRLCTDRGTEFKGAFGQFLVGKCRNSVMVCTPARIDTKNSQQDKQKPTNPDENNLFCYYKTFG